MYDKNRREASSYRATQKIISKQSTFGLRSFEGKKFRSKWEHSFAVYLKEIGIEYKFEEYGGGIENISGVLLHYIPDFYLPEYDIYIEIVNEMDKRLAHKMLMFQEQHDKILLVLDKQHLNQMFNSEFTIYDVFRKQGIKIKKKGKGKKK